MKKRIIYFLSIVGILVACIFIYLYVGFSQSREGANAALRSFDPTTASGKIATARRVEIQERVDQENIARKFFEAGDYDRAIKEYRKAAEMSKYDQWVPRYRLSEVYEKGGYNELAIQEINWLLAQKPSQRVADELAARKKSLEAKLTGVKKTANIIDGVTNKDYVVKELGNPTEILKLQNEQEAWIYRDYMDISKSMPHLADKQPYVVILDKNNIVVDNYITDNKSIDVLKKQEVATSASPNPA